MEQVLRHLVHSLDAEPLQPSVAIVAVVLQSVIHRSQLRVYRLVYLAQLVRCLRCLATIWLNLVRRLALFGQQLRRVRRIGHHAAQRPHTGHPLLQLPREKRRLLVQMQAVLLLPDRRHRRQCRHQHCLLPCRHGLGLAAGYCLRLRRPPRALAHDRLVRVIHQPLADEHRPHLIYIYRQPPCACRIVAIAQRLLGKVASELHRTNQPQSLFHHATVVLRPCPVLLLQPLQAHQPAPLKILQLHGQRLALLGCHLSKVLHFLHSYYFVVRNTIVFVSDGKITKRPRSGADTKKAPVAV